VANKALLISIAMVVLFPIVPISRASGEGNQNFTKLRVRALPKKSVPLSPRLADD
jgi:hypothetical protein